MNNFTKHLFQITLLVSCWLSISPALNAAGLMTASDSQHQPLKIKQHHVNVVIEDGYAITYVDQIFHNPNSTDLEAIYSFPVPEKASVSEFTYWIDDKPVTAEVVEKQKAREIYTEQKSKGNEVALTEKDEYRAFESWVYPVRNQQDVKIRLVYIQPVHVDNSIGRYVYPLEEGGVDEQKLAFWNYDVEVTEAFSFNMSLRSGYPLDGVRLPKHPQVQVTSLSDQEWTASMTNQVVKMGAAEESAVETHGNNPAVVQRLDQDIVVYWRLQQGLPGSIDMVSHKEPGSHRGTFMMTITPGDDLAPITEGKDWVFVLDLSGSMKGKYQSLVDGVKKGLDRLNPKDRFRIILFNNTSHEITNGYTIVTAETVRDYTQQLENIPPGGGTNLYAGLKKGINGLDSDRSSAIILVTDGVANVGTTEKKAFLKLLEQHDVRLFTFVMGNSANRPLLQGMSKISNGFSMNVSNSDDIMGKIILATGKLTHQAMHDIEVKVDGVKVKDISPANISSLYRGEQLIILGHYWGDGVADVAINGKISGQKQSYKTSVEFPAEMTSNPEIERLWAFATIEDLQNQIDYLGEDADTKEAIVGIAKEYSLVTNYTSMLVLRDEVFAQYNIERNNSKRLAKENKARVQRENSAIKNHRQDTHKPAFKQNRAYPKKSGGGNGGPWSILLLLPLLMAWRQSHTNSKLS